ncbi:MAG: ATP-binding protein, partial [Chloroflexota bacterium]|nr:ATP-binding protein [Chloroflexota bacterium]
KVGRFTQATGIPCELELSLKEHQLSPETSNHVLGILSESLANVARHARATQAQVKFIAERDQLDLEIRDNGQGFDLGQQNGSGHYGLLGMRERARLIGGVLTIDSDAESGTKVCLRVPETGSLQ